MTRRISRNISLTPDLEDVVEERVKSGLYRSASEYVRELVRKDVIRELQAQEIRTKIAEGVRSIEQGKVVDGESFLRSWEKRLSKRNP